MPVRLTSVVFEAADPEALAYFWEGNVEDWSTHRRPGGEAHIHPSEEDGCALDLVFTPARLGPKGGKNRIHLDVNSWGTHQYQANREAIPHIGGRLVDIGQGELVPWTVFADPEGNEFCLLKPRERYSDTGELAAIVVDCAEPARLASFWSSATGWEIVESETDFVSMRAPGQLARGPFLEFSRVADRSQEPSRVYLGFESYWAHQHDGDVAALCELGARWVRKHDGEPVYSVLADPEGNEFRVVAPVWPPALDERPPSLPPLDGSS